MQTRREFLYLSAASLAAISLEKMYCSRPVGEKIIPGLQLYSVRDLFEKEPKRILKQLSKMDYVHLESYERNEDMFWGLTPKGFQDYVRDLGMTLISSHCDIDRNFEKKVEQAASIGMKYLVFNWPYAQQPMDEYKKRADQFNRCGELCKKAGLHFGYHNYESSFKLVDGAYPHDVLMQRTEAGLVHHQMDMYWVASAGQDPMVWLKKYPNRFTSCHIKDGQPDGSGKAKTCELGRGTIRYYDILRVAKANGMQYYFAEQEDYPYGTPMASAKWNAKFLKKVRV